jgi:hypothetical protein
MSRLQSSFYFMAASLLDSDTAEGVSAADVDSLVASMADNADVDSFNE